MSEPEEQQASQDKSSGPEWTHPRAGRYETVIDGRTVVVQREGAGYSEERWYVCDSNGVHLDNWRGQEMEHYSARGARDEAEYEYVIRPQMLNQQGSRQRGGRK